MWPSSGTLGLTITYFFSCYSPHTGPTKTTVQENMKNLTKQNTHIGIHKQELAKGARQKEKEENIHF
jgi:hypothetical protein